MTEETHSPNFVRPGITRPGGTLLLVRQGNLVYTHPMRTIDIGWRDLAAGYETIRASQGSLEKEFGRAVRIGHARKFHRELTEWQKKRRVFIALAVIAPLSIIGLCVSAYYFRDVACVIVYWAVVVLTILVALAVAGRNYIREAIDRPEPQQTGGIVVDLEQRWWNGLSPKPLAVVKKRGSGEDFPALLGRSLPDAYLALPGVPDPDGQELILAGPSGIWLFEVRPWSGKIVKQEGLWREVQTLRNKLGRGRREERVHEAGPDDRWLQRKDEILKVIRKKLPGLVRTPEAVPDDGSSAGSADLVQGGVVFSHSHAAVDKTRTKGNTAAYGPASAWAERVLRSQPRAGFKQEACLQVLDALAARAVTGMPGQVETASAREEAERLYQEAVKEMRSYITRMVS